MLAGHRLALALGVVGPEAVTGDDDMSRKQLIRAGEAMVDAGLAIVLNRAGTKIPLCTLTAVERKKADQAARDEAAANGDPNSHRRVHRCGLVHAISDMKTATRVLTRMSQRERFNIGVEPRGSRVVIVDLDTAGQSAEFALRCGRDRPSLTVRSPGSRDKFGNWVHKDGGHIWFDVPDGVELPVSEGVYTDEAGWSVMWGEHQVLVPPSARAEGPYVLVGSMHPLPEWLLDLITTESLAKSERRVEARRRRELAGPSEIDDWATDTAWSDILLADGWVETGLLKSCGCPQWTAPGEHASPESATAHEPGCSVYMCERGHGPLRVWTDNPSEAVSAAMAEYGTRTLTKLQVYTHAEGDGRMGRTLSELGIDRADGPTVLSSYSTWAEDESGESQAEPGSVTVDGELVEDSDEGTDDEVPIPVDPETMFERRVRKEYEHELVRRAALERIQAADAPPLRVWGFGEFLTSPRPEPLVPKMLYRDSLARMFGAPGGGKSFLAMDVALSVALGRFWGGTRLAAGRVIYVMAEGQRVNGDRAAAWLSKHGVDESALEGQFFTVPDAVLLTEAASVDFVREVRRIRPVLVVLDTKNAMMVGEENSATDFAVMRRTLDAIRKAADCCVMLVDHTGYEGTRARGTSAGTAAMDTEIRVVKDDDQRPALVTVDVTRDKAGEAGSAWAFRLLPEHPAAVLVPTDVPREVGEDTRPEWALDGTPLPDAIEGFEGAGQRAMVPLARYMRMAAGPKGDMARIGRSLADARTELKDEVDRKTVGIAWSALKAMGYLESRFETPTESQERTGAHVWNDPHRSAK